MSLNQKLSLPLWLPERLTPDPKGYDATVANAYKIFKQDFEVKPILFKNKTIKLYTTQAYLGYIESFWHVTSKNAEPNSTQIEKDNIRIPDFDRVIRIPWLRPLLTQGFQQDYLLITEERVKKGRNIITYSWWSNDVAHLIVLKDRGYDWQLISAYHFSPKTSAFKKKVEKIYPCLRNLKTFPNSSYDCIQILLNQKSVPYYK